MSTPRRTLPDLGLPDDTLRELLSKYPDLLLPPALVGALAEAATRRAVALASTSFDPAALASLLGAFGGAPVPSTPITNVPSYRGATGLGWTSLKWNGVDLSSVTSQKLGVNLPDKPRRARPPLRDSPAAPYRADREPSPRRQYEPPSTPRSGSHVTVRHARHRELFGHYGHDDDGVPDLARHVPAGLLADLYALADLRFTGLARGWRATVVISSSGADLALDWDTYDRDTGAPLRLVYTTWVDHRYLERVTPLGWLREAFRYVFRHEADETLVTPDGKRPFDPHRADGSLREPPEHLVDRDRPVRR